MQAYANGPPPSTHINNTSLNVSTTTSRTPYEIDKAVAEVSTFLNRLHPETTHTHNFDGQQKLFDALCYFDQNSQATKDQIFDIIDANRDKRTFKVIEENQRIQLLEIGHSFFSGKYWTTVASIPKEQVQITFGLLANVLVSNRFNLRAVELTETQKVFVDNLQLNLRGGCYNATLNIEKFSLDKLLTIAAQVWHKHPEDNSFAMSAKRFILNIFNDPSKQAGACSLDNWTLLKIALIITQEEYSPANKNAACWAVDFILKNNQSEILNNLYVSQQSHAIELAAKLTVSEGKSLFSIPANQWAAFSAKFANNAEKLIAAQSRDKRVAQREQLMRLFNETCIAKNEICASGIDNDGAQFLASILRENNSIVKLSIRTALMEAVTAQGLAQAIKASWQLVTVEFGNIGKAPTGDGVLPDLVQALSGCRRLQELCLSHNTDMSKQTIANIATILTTNSSLSSFNLSCCKIGAEGIRPIIAALAHCKKLQHLDLSFNCLERGGVIPVARMLESSENLLSLCLEGNQLDDRGMLAVSAALSKNNTLAFLDVGVNRYKEQGLRSLADALAHNSTLRFLIVDDGQLDKALLTFSRIFIDVLENNNKSLFFLKRSSQALNEAQELAMSAINGLLAKNRATIDPRIIEQIFGALSPSIRGQSTLAQFVMG